MHIICPMYAKLVKMTLAPTKTIYSMTYHPYNWVAYNYLNKDVYIKEMYNQK